ncbi:MAG TPA: VWA domain-containing protein [Thermoanaerobaculia bacterium]|jgi:VWFA-related protein
MKIEKPLPEGVRAARYAVASRADAAAEVAASVANRRAASTLVSLRRFPMRIHLGLFAAGLAALLLAPGAALSAQTPAPDKPPANEPLQPTPTFGERIEVRVVNVEVVVTDRQGNRVPGLTAADFRLKVDGKTVPIDYFTEVRGGDAIAPEPGAATTVRGLPTLEPGSPVGTSYLVFVDDYFSITARRDDVLRKLKDDLARLGPDDRMAIVAFDGQRLDMLASWTNSERALSHALTEAARRPAYGLQRVAELNAFETGRRVRGGGLGGVTNPRFDITSRLDTEELSYALRLSDQIGRSVQAAVSTLRGFASPPGRKVMLMLTGGWPYSPADYAVNNTNRPLLEREVPNGDTLLRPLDDTANLLGYTVYPVDVQNLERNSVDASRQSPIPQQAIAVRDNEVRSTLLAVADQTGGRAILGGLRDSPLAAVAADTRSYYWLGFTPAFKRDDARHKLQAEVSKGGLKVRTRQGYLDLSSHGEGALMVESAMLFGTPADAPRLPIELGQIKPAGRREVEVPVTVAIPVSAVTFVPLEGKYVAELEFRAAALDKDGNRSDVPLVDFKLTLEKQPDPGKYVPFRTTLRLRKIQQHLTVAIFDPLSSKVLTTSADYNPEAKRK